MVTTTIVPNQDVKPLVSDSSSSANPPQASLEGGILQLDKATQLQPTHTEQIAIQFLFQDFVNLREFNKAAGDSANKRTSFYFTLGSAAVAVIALLSQTDIDPQDLFTFMLVAASILLALGLITLQQIMVLNVHQAEYVRGINLIRRYFSQLDPTVSQFLWLPTSVSTPRYDWWFSNRHILMLSNSIAAGSCGTLIAQLAFHISGIYVPTPWLVLSGVLIAVLAQLLQSLYVREYYQRAEQFASELQGRTILNIEDYDQFLKFTSMRQMGRDRLKSLLKH